jgi:hypothetical protein
LRAPFPFLHTKFEVKEKVMTAEERDRILAQLAEPFDVREIKWRVTQTANKGTRGMVKPYADPRAYHDRLNKVLTASGWTSSYHVCTLTNIMRARGNNKEVMSGKVLSTCTVTIDGIGTHSGTGEEWADSDCAMTSADAQSFKRACSAFGLGRYTYSVPGVWVDLDEYRQPKRLPQLPKSALPGNTVETGKTVAPVSADVTQHQKGGSANATSIEPKLIEEIERYRRELGKGLYYEVINKVGKAGEAREIVSKEVADVVLEWVQRAKRGIDKARELGEKVSVGQYDYIFQHVGVENLSTVPSMSVLSKLVNMLVDAASKAA